MMNNTITQKVHHLDLEQGKVYLESRLGKIYPVEVNRYIKNINPGDMVTIEITTNGYKLIDCESVGNPILNIVEFPLTEKGDLNYIAYLQYLEAIEGMTKAERIRFDEYLIKKYNIRRRIR